MFSPLIENNTMIENNTKLMMEVERYAREFLSEEESNIAISVILGHSIKTSSEMLNLSINKIRKGRMNIYETVGVSSKAEFLSHFMFSTAVRILDS